MRGKIYLVGAGPGDYGLLTLRGYEILKRADMVVYDRLVGDGVLSFIPDNAEVIDAGKTAGNHSMEQDKIIAKMIANAFCGKTVVRLKGGDPYLFGRGGEEAEAARVSFVDFEIIPGITSALSVPAYGGIPVTHRDYSSGVSIFTAHDRYFSIPDLSSSTLIFLMGVGNSEALQKKLLEKMPPETPCAIIENGTTSLQRTIRTPLLQLHSTVKSEGIMPPAILVVGETANFNLSWREKLPLFGKKIIITRPEGRGEELSSKLRDLGAEVVMMPTIKPNIIHGSIDNVKLSGYDWIGFTSATGVDALFGLLCETGRDIREIGSAKISAIGSATCDALKLHGLKVDYMPEIFDGEHLAEGLAETGGKILMFRSENGTPEIDKVFINRGVNFDNVCIYRTDYVKLHHIPEFADIIIFTSSSTVRGLAVNTDELREATAVCIGFQTAEEARKAGFSNIKVAERALTEELVEACKNIIGGNNHA